MAAMRARILARSIFSPVLQSRISAARCASTKSRSGEKKSLACKAEVQRLLYQAVERYKPGRVVEPVPRINLDHVTISSSTSGQGGPQANKVKSKIEMRFNVKNAQWLSDRVRERIMQMEKSRINKDGEIVISSSKIRAQKSNVEDAVAKLQVFNYQKKKLQAIIDSASYAPPPPSKETLKTIELLSTLGEQKKLENKKALQRS